MVRSWARVAARLVVVVAMVTCGVRTARAEGGDPERAPRFTWTAPMVTMQNVALGKAQFHALEKSNGVYGDQTYSGSQLGVSRPTFYGPGFSAHFAPFPSARFFSLYAAGAIGFGSIDAIPTDAGAYDRATSGHNPLAILLATGPEVQLSIGTSLVARAGLGIGWRHVSFNGGPASTNSTFLEPRVSVDIVIVDGRPGEQGAAMGFSLGTFVEGAVGGSMASSFAIGVGPTLTVF
jgi:hypothetical protein